MTQPARLTGNLLARKGRALPADGLADAAIALSRPLPAWPGHRPGPPAAGNADARSAGPRLDSRGAAAPRRDGRVTLTVRLDPARHTRLRILAARRQRTSQDVVVEALDRYLDACGVDCACLRGESEGCGRN